jgi:phage tail-like protein
MANYPLENMQFVVNWGGDQIGFSEVSGLTMSNDVVEYRDGTAPEPNTIKMPGLRKFTNIILKRGVISGNYNLYNWMNSISGNTVERRDLTITLLDSARSPVLVWKVTNAWPCRLSYSPLIAGESRVMMEEVEIVHEGLTVQNSNG